MSSVQDATDWRSIAPRFAWDGSLRDIVVRDCTADDWESLFKALIKLNGVRLVLPASGADFWADPGAIFSRFAGKPIFLSRNHINLKCDLVSPELIEFDLDPREIKGQSDLDALLFIMNATSSILGKPVFLTEEGAHADVIIRVDPLRDHSL